MEEARGTIVLVAIAVYMASCLAIGLWAMRRTKSTRDFFVAGRDLGILVTGLAIFSSTMSGFGFVGGPGLVYRMGLSVMWIIIGIPIGYCVSFFLLGKRLRLFGELLDSVSLPDVVAARYRSELCRFLAALAILLGVIGYLGAQILAMATILQDILEQNPWMGDISLFHCVFISSAVLVFYCVTGGIIASVYTDLVQGLVMMVAAVFVFFTAMHTFEGGFSGMVQTIAADDAGAVGPWGTVGMLGCLSWFFLFAVGSAGQPHVITKMMMNRRIEDARHILPLSAIGYTLSALLIISVGMVMRALVLSGSHADLDHSDAAAPQFLQTYAHPVLAGIVFAGLFAAIMSTADAFLNVGAAALVHDMPRAILGRSLVHELFWARCATAALALMAAVFALYTQDLVALLGAFGWGTFAAALVPVVAIGLNWKRATALAANVAIITSLLVNFVLKLSSRITGFEIPYAIDGGTVSLLVSLLLFFLISFCSRQPKLDPDIEAVMDM